MREFPKPNFRRDVGRLFRYGSLYGGGGSLPLLRQAFAIASESHATQVRSDGSPYVVHLARVASYALRYGPEPTQAVAAAALLHDAVEDTSLSLEVIEDCLGGDVSSMVSDLTRHRPIQEEFGQRARGKAIKLKELSVASVAVRYIKCFDLLDNVLSWKYIAEGHPHARKIPRWLAEARILYVPFCLETYPPAANLIEKEIESFSRRGVEPGPLAAY